ncbi:hypothetical protein FVEG_06766 [Fusarium verticillioides 7600]|uniref:Uncharacterized protein n=1 Tax=Gibberella moniliformis (strain M3125 / FGSC 7600) TaxID=334819 RepID=W7M3P6_GIBM7|nr:hypothetical protein FVEG_06766 [Fusarium verticillioides 7600]EWG46208.1 hypothetical protein FVEG_06766 [Fusarium verticillioides 7600]
MLREMGQLSAKHHRLINHKFQTLFTSHEDPQEFCLVLIRTLFDFAHLFLQPRQHIILSTDALCLAVSV